MPRYEWSALTALCLAAAAAVTAQESERTAGAPAQSAATAQPALPSVASINVCTDQLVLSLADPEQILTVSWLSADPEESMLAAEAARYPLNYGSAEELLRYAPDVIVAGSLTSAFTRTLLTSLGHTVVAIPPAESFAEIEATLRVVAAAVGQPARGDALIAAMRERRERFVGIRPARALRAIVVRPGGFTAGARTLSHEMMTLAGLANVSADQGLDRWGSLAMETLLRSDPELLIFTGYRGDQASLANAVLGHPALARLTARTAAVTVQGAQWSCGLPGSLDSVASMLHAARSVLAGAHRLGAHR